MNSVVSEFRDALVSELASGDGGYQAKPLIDALSRNGMVPLTVADAGGAQELRVVAEEAIACGERLATALRAVLPLVDFYPFLERAEVSPILKTGLFAGQIARHDTPPARLGLFLLAPGLHYPIHQHEAIEVYYCASGNLELQHGTKGAPFTLEPGMFSLTPSNRLHALTTGAAPCLLIYAWCGNVTAPAWWWEEEADGTWARVKWVRRDDGRWVIAAREPVNAAILAEAGEG